MLSSGTTVKKCLAEKNATRTSSITRQKSDGLKWLRRYLKQGCQMVCFRTKNHNLGKFWRALEWKLLVYFMVIWNILRSFVIFYGHLEYFTAIWYSLWPFGNVVVIWHNFPRFGKLCREKSGNPDLKSI
jgi:hypothetical protein